MELAPRTQDEILEGWKHEETDVLITLLRLYRKQRQDGKRDTTHDARTGMLEALLRIRGIDPDSQEDSDEAEGN